MTKRKTSNRNSQNSPVQQNFFLKKDQMEVAESIRPGTLNDTVAMVQKQQEHDNAIDIKVCSFRETELRQRDEELRQNDKLIRQQGRKNHYYVLLAIVGITGVFYFLTQKDYLAASVFAGIVGSLIGSIKWLLK